jgi:hypothetical protein
MLLQQATERRSVKASRSTGGEDRGRRPPRASVIATRRSEGPDFTASFLELQELVHGACKRESRWEAKVVAGIGASLDFAATEPAKARALTVGARRPAFGERYPEQVVISYFARELGAVAPRARRVAISTDESIVEAIALLVRGHLLQGTEVRLPVAAPDLIYLALVPYLGLGEARDWAESAAPPGEGQ